MKKFGVKILTVFVIMLCGNLLMAQTVTVDGNVYLENQNNHDSIKIVFERTAPSSLFDTAFTNINGEYSMPLQQGVYRITYSKTNYFNWIIYDTALYSNVTLQDINLYEESTLLNVPSIFTSIQLAIDVSSNGDTILVKQGTYYENLNFNGKNVMLASEFIINKDTSFITNTVIDGNQNGRVIEFTNGEDSTASVVGFTIANGKTLGTTFPDDCGGGIYISDAPSYISIFSPIISHTIIKDNIANNLGGGIYCGNYTKPKFINVEISNNQAGCGGIACDYGSKPTLINVKISENISSYVTIYLSNSNAIFKNVIISNNSNGWRGGIYCDRSNPIIHNSTIVNNTNGEGAINCTYNSNPIIYNSIIANNNVSKGGIYNESGNPIIYNSCLWNNGTSNFYNCDPYLGINLTTNNNGDSSDVFGNIQIIPVFIDSLNFNLQVGSPCIDAGSNNYIDFQYDYKDNCRIYNGNSDNLFVVDMGAYEYGAHYLTPLDLGYDTTICEGNSFILDATNNYFSYNWNDSNSFNQTITTDTTGYYHLIVFDGNGCMAYDNIVVTVNPLPIVNLGNDTSICDGSYLYLYPGSGSKYLWNNGYNNSYLLVDSVGVYSVAVTDNYYCVNYDTIAVNINPIPYLNLGNDTIITDTIVFLNAGTGYLTYLWNDNSTNQFLSVFISGTYSVLVTDSNGCNNLDSISISINNDINENRLSNYGISVFPNPTTGNISILGKNKSIAIANIEGQIIQKIEGNNEKNNIDLSPCSKGIYVVKIVTDKGVLIKKIVLE